MRARTALKLGLIASAISSMSSAAALAAPSGIDGAAIVRGAGRVKVEGTHDWRDTVTGDVLAAGMAIQASDNQPLEMILPDGVTVTLEPHALAEWMPAAKLPSETNRWTRGYHLILQEGELEVRMPPAQKGAHAFLVSTKAGTLTDWRGQLHVKVHEDSTAAAIYEGALVVGSNGQGFPVYDGAGILMRRGVNPDKTRVIPMSPQWVANDGSFSIATDLTPANLDLAWQPVPHAASYRVEIASDPTMVRILERATISEPHYTPKHVASTGRYFAHVRAVGDAGIVGAWSAPRAVHIVRLALPIDAFVANDGTVVLPEGATVGVESAEPLQVAYENVTTLSRGFSVPLYWAALAGRIRLGEDATMRIVHLRDPDPNSPASGRIVLARRELKARVDLGPARARWPLDPVDARIEVTDPSGRIDIAGAGVVVQAMLDLTPLSVPWERNGSVWTGRIMPRLIADPSVLRVLVKDGHGSEIGRGFLELEPASR